SRLRVSLSGPFEEERILPGVSDLHRSYADHLPPFIAELRDRSGEGGIGVEISFYIFHFEFGVLEISDPILSCPVRDRVVCLRYSAVLASCPVRRTLGLNLLGLKLRGSLTRRESRSKDRASSQQNYNQ